jgi:Reverse transcriptase (RNA-dependent DNA polymerase)
MTTNGVKQGGVSSPILFCIYIDDMLVRLAGLGVGCYIGGTYVGALSYADDIVLIAPTV